MTADYDRAQFAETLRRVGVRKDDTIFSHSNVGFFGTPEGGRTAANIHDTIAGAFFDVMGPGGTLVVPTFTYSYCNGEPFDPDATLSTCGLFTELVRKDPAALRSHDALFSVAAVGARARELTADAPAECFGEKSFWARFLAADGLICNLNFDAGSTFIHFVERRIGVPYRFDKIFRGTTRVAGVAIENEFTFFCRRLDFPGGARARFEPFDARGREVGIVRSERVGRGSVVALRAADTCDLIETELRRDPRFLIVS